MKTISRSARYNLLASAMMTMSLAGTAAAEVVGESASQIGEIVVTAERRETRLQQTPISVAAMTGEALEKRSVQDVFDLQQMVPGLVMSHVFQALPYIRGIGTDLQGIGTDSSVAMHVDGIYITRPNAVVQDFYDVERIEVLRGPQGTLYGRNATGGVINVISKQPTRQLSAAADLLYGNYNKVRFRAAVSGPLVEDKLLARVAVLTSNRDGFVRNLALGTRLLDEDVMSARGILKFLGEGFDAVLTVDGTRNRSKGIVDVVIDPQNNIGALSGGRFNKPGDFFTVYSDIEGPLKRDQYGVSLKVNVDLGNAELTSTSAYRATSTRRSLDSDGTDFPVVGERGSPEKSKAFTQEIQLTSVGDGPLTWVVGAFYLHEDAKATVRVDFPLIGGFLTIPATNKVNALAGFGQATYAVNEKLHVTAGLRYSYERKVEANSTTFNGIVTAVAGGKKSWNALTPKFVIDYRFTDDVMAYGSVTRGFKSGGFNSTGVEPAFDPEYIWSYEAGIKGSYFDRRLRANISAFYYDYTDLQVNVINGISTAVTNAASARVYGGELELAASPVRGLDIEAGLALLSAKFRELMTEDPTVPGVLQNLAGNRLARAPRSTVNLAAQYSWDLAQQGNLAVRGEYQHSGGVYFSQYNAPFERQKSYGIYNAKISWTSMDDRWTISVFGKNLGNKNYLLNAVRLALIGGGTVGQPAAPRTYGINVGFAI